MTNPMAIQHGGSHYKGMKIEPFEMSLANQYDGAIHSIVKYVSRHAAKNGAEDLAKAHHITAIRLAQMKVYGTRPSNRRITVGQYVRENQIDGPEATVLMWADDWSAERHTTAMNEHFTLKLQQAIIQLIAIRYPDFDLQTLKG